MSFLHFHKSFNRIFEYLLKNVSKCENIFEYLLKTVSKCENIFPHFFSSESVSPDGEKCTPLIIDSFSVINYPLSIFM